MDRKAEEVWANHNPIIHETDIVTIKTSLQYEHPRVYVKSTKSGESSYWVMKTTSSRKYGR